MKQLIFFLIVFVIFGWACKNPQPDPFQEQTHTESDSLKGLTSFTGNYVNEDYFKRHQGYDWLAIQVSAKSDSVLHIAVRSRFDRKKPTCTFDADVVAVAPNKFEATLSNKKILIVFSDHSISINTADSSDKDMLQYYCSGGGNFAGVYQKLSEPIDAQQIDPRIFVKTLYNGSIGFDVSTVAKGQGQQLVVQPFGLTIDNQKIEMALQGRVTGAEVGDLNTDGFPELLVYTVSADGQYRAEAIGFSVNGGKSVSQVYFPPPAENPKISNGYRGGDEFAIVESNLVQRFKIFKDGNDSLVPTGKMRQIQYKLKEGEAMRKFVLDKIVEF